MECSDQKATKRSLANVFFGYSRHMWEDKGAEMLRVIQLNTLEDRAVHDKQQWDSANQFLEKCLTERLGQSEANLRDQVS